MAAPTSADAELILHLYEIRREPLLREARNWFLTEYQPRPWDEMKREEHWSRLPHERAPRRGKARAAKR